MKIRSILYGYHYVNAQKAINPNDCAVVQEIYARYQSGESFGSIAKLLTDRGIQYAPENNVWHKARIKRILQDSRYLGLKGYPQLITQVQYDDIQQMINAVNSNKVEVDKDTQFIRANIICAHCSSPIVRKIKPRQDPANFVGLS